MRGCKDNHSRVMHALRQHAVDSQMTLLSLSKLDTYQACTGVQELKTDTIIGRFAIRSGEGDDVPTCRTRDYQPQ